MSWILLTWCRPTWLPWPLFTQYSDQQTPRHQIAPRSSSLPPQGGTAVTHSTERLHQQQRANVHGGKEEGEEEGMVFPLACPFMDSFTTVPE